MKFAPGCRPSDNLPGRRLLENREDINAVLHISMRESYNHLPPRNIHGKVLISDAHNLIIRASRKGAESKFIPSDLLNMDEAQQATGFSRRRLYRWVHRIPHYEISQKVLLVRMFDLETALNKKRRRTISRKPYQEADQDAIPQDAMEDAIAQ